MRKSWCIFIYIIAFLLFTPFVKGQVNAAFLKFDKTSYSVAKDGTVQVGVVLDAGSDSVRSTDIYVTYDPAMVQALMVTPDTFFPTVTNDITSGRVAINAYVDDAAASKTGSGTVAKITFKGLTNGTGTLAFDCGSSTGSKITKNDVNFTNIIVCTQNTTASMAVGTGVNTSPTVAPTGQLTPTPSILPKSGIFDNVIKFAVPGTVFLLIGLALKLL